MSLKIQQYCLIIACAFIVGGCNIGKDDKQRSAPDFQSFFAANYSDSILGITLSFDLDSLIERKKEEDEIRAYLEIPSKGITQIPLKISARGVNRKERCIFPPIRLNFSKENLKLNHWNDYDKYKLVTHCLGSGFNDELLLREYLVYKLYEQISEVCFRTQLLKVKYVTPLDTIDRYAFLLENEKELAERLGMNIMDIKESTLKNIHFERYKKFVLFQYMIGNTDWNLNGGHNTRYVLDKESQTPIVIPYDFDQAGLVNASYAKPHSSLPITHVRDRYFMYRGKNVDDFNQIKKELVGNKDIIYSTILDFPLITLDAKTDMIEYLQGFYDIIEADNWKSMISPKDLD